MTAVPETLLDVRDLLIRFRTHDGTIYAVNGISFQLARGERLGLAGGGFEHRVRIRHD